MLEYVNIVWVVYLIPLSLTFSQKKIKLSTTENLAVIPEVHEKENGSSQGCIHKHLSPVKKDKKKLTNLSSHPNKSNKSGPTSDETRCVFNF